jgi:hypothetical protein
VTLAVVATFAVGVGLGILLLQGMETGETWEDWQAAIGGRWFNIAQYGLIAMFVAGFLVQGEVGAILISVPAGACVVFFTVGVRRRWRARHDPRPEAPPEEEDEFEEPWHWNVIGFTSVLLIGAAVLYAVGLRGLELVLVPLGALLVVIASEKLGDRLANWIRR